MNGVVARLRAWNENDADSERDRQILKDLIEDSSGFVDLIPMMDRFTLLDVIWTSYLLDIAVDRQVVLHVLARLAESNVLNESGFSGVSSYAKAILFALTDDLVWGRKIYQPAEVIDFTAPSFSSVYDVLKTMSMSGSKSVRQLFQEWLSLRAMEGDIEVKILALLKEKNENYGC